MGGGWFPREGVRKVPEELGRGRPSAWQAYLLVGLSIYLLYLSTYLPTYLPVHSFHWIKNFLFKIFMLKTIKLIALTGPGDPPSGYWMIKPCSQTRATQHFKNFILPQFSSPSNCSSVPLTKSQSCSSGIFFQSFKKSFPIPKLFHMYRKELSTWVHILAIRFLGGQTTGQKTISSWLFSLETEWNFSGNSVLQTRRLKVKLWNGPVLYFASFFRNPSVSSSLHLYPRSPLP